MKREDQICRYLCEIEKGGVYFSLPSCGKLRFLKCGRGVSLKRRPIRHDSADAAVGGVRGDAPEIQERNFHC